MFLLELCMDKWLNKNILLLSLSAFFADSGYQMIIAGLPLFIVLYLNEPVYVFGIATAIGYGGGALFGYLGGILADGRYGRKKIAILGNSLIPILSFIGFASNAVEAISIFSTGWWARNFRTPARRAMLSDEATPQNKAKVFGFLHALDIGGTLTAVTLLSLFLYINLKFNVIFLISIIPITISTLCILFVKERKKHVENKKLEDKTVKTNSKVFRGIILSTMLYGFSFYSMGFPVLTIAQKSTDIYGVLAYGIMMLVSALAGYLLGSVRSISKTKALAYLGYGLAGVGSLTIGIAYELSFNIALYIGAIVLGFSLGAIETFEPTIIALVSKAKELGKNMGALTSSRSVGLFASNIIMGILYFSNPTYSYIYAAVIAFSASIIILISTIEKD